MQKLCTKCKQWKDENEFSWKNKPKGKRHSQCKECRRKADNEKYKTDPDRRKSLKETHHKQVELVRNYLLDVKKHSKCAFCGDDRWYVLDFHHLRDKSFTISQIVTKGVSLNTIKSELAKCITLCANCHRELHYKENLNLFNTLSPILEAH